MRDEANGTGMLGFASSNVCTMAPSLRWKRLISPHGTLPAAEILRQPVGRFARARRAAARAVVRSAM